MTYTAIINGARGVDFQGPERPLSLNATDAPFGWNWTYWRRVLKPLFQEIGDKSPLYPALIAPDSKLSIKVDHPNEIEFCTRELGDEIFILASKHEGDTIKVTFTGLPPTESSGVLLYEEPRKINIKDGTFEDWFAPFEIHVYRIKRKA
jgi:hypothetical protein